MKCTGKLNFLVKNNWKVSTNPDISRPQLEQFAINTKLEK